MQDLAGWRRERMPRIPRGHRFEIVPDWVCEGLSSPTEGKDRDIKMPIYAKYGVAHASLLDPRTRTIEVYRLEAQGWREINRFTGDQPARIPPFHAVSLDLAAPWSDDPDRLDPTPDPVGYPPEIGVPSLRVEIARMPYTEPRLRSVWTCSSMGSRAAAAGGLRR